MTQVKMKTRLLQMFVFFCGLIPALAFGGKPIKDIKVSATFADREGDMIRSDGHGLYEGRRIRIDGGYGVRMSIPKGRSVFFDLSDCLEGECATPFDPDTEGLVEDVYFELNGVDAGATHGETNLGYLRIFFSHEGKGWKFVGDGNQVQLTAYDTDNDGEVDQWIGIQLAYDEINNPTAKYRLYRKPKLHGAMYELVGYYSIPFQITFNRLD